MDQALSLIRRRLWPIVGGVVALAIFVVVLVLAERQRWLAFMPADQPVTADQLLARLTADGWVDVKIAPQGSYLHAIGKRGGQVIWVTVDPATGRRWFDDDVQF